MDPARAGRSTLALLLAVLTLCACSSSVPPADIRQNPHPVKRYTLTVTVEDAPGPFESIGGTVDYQVTNSGCVPLQPVSGARLAPHRQMPIRLQGIGDNTYEGSFFADLMLDADYYQMGTCHWALVGVGAQLKTRSTGFSSAIWAKDIAAGKAAITYFPKVSYRDPTGGMSGQPLTTYVSEHPDAFFHVALATKEAAR
ncbi:hypothetical protein [Frateuria sp. STR12]|uniref:hypothetical protein n=1 Tax=Frateuria hangzhouensis TaxID=2995589 RepID=UPI002260ED5B|nr:hypothetical protein [Frateuria sp. STR12]MCX7512520.1 hypothetical protein [Frateuria sp. STR12]